MSAPIPVLLFPSAGCERLPLCASLVHAGFPSPAEDHLEAPLDLTELLVRHRAATFLLRVVGDSMTGAGIFPQDILIVDRAIRPQSGMVVVAALDGEFTVKRLQRRSDGSLLLLPENPRYPPIQVTAEQDAVVWGVVTYVLHDPNRV